MIASSQTNQNANRDLQIDFKSKAGETVTIEVIDNIKWTIPYAIVLMGDRTEIEKELESCENWNQLQNRTYVLNENLSSREDIQESIDFLLNNQKLIDAQLYLFQLKDEFEPIETKHGNITGGTIIQRKEKGLCQAVQKIIN